MAENSKEASGKRTIKLIIKTAKEKETIEVKENASVKELKKLVSERFKTEEDLICLIFAGKILKENENLDNHKIKDGLTVHLVIRSKKPSEEPPQTSAPNAVPNERNSSTDGPIPQPFGGGFGAMGNMSDMQREIMQNPELMRQMMENPLVQSLMSNPDYVRSMLTSNPQMQQLMERNPEISHMLNNPEILRQTMDMVRNPAALQELMRTQDRALSNLESIPGGYNALRRMYTELQEPMMNAAQEQFGSNPFATAASQDTNRGNDSSQRGQEVRDPLPNPWAPRSNDSSRPAGTGAQTTNSALPASDLSSSSTQNLMQQLMSNPESMNNLMTSPYIQNMMQTISRNPELMRQMLASSPLTARNPELQEQMNQMMPQIMEQMQNPQMQALLSNPQALEAIMQVQRGMEQLNRIAPDLVSPPGNLSTTTTSPGNAPPNPNAANIGALSQLLSQMQTNNQQLPPEERYRTQLDQLAAMGFTNREANIQALNATFGDINAAIERLLQLPR